MELRSRLFKILGEIIPTLQERELCHRKKHKLMAEDIYIIGNSLVSTMEDKRLKKFLKPSNIKMNESLDQSEMNTICIDVEQDKNESNLLQICVELKVSVQELVGKVKHLEEKMVILEKEATESKLQIKLLTDARKKLGPNEQIVEAEVHADINGVQQMPRKAEYKINKRTIQVSNSEELTAARSSDDNTPFHHTSAERRDILRGIKRNQGIKKNSTVLISIWMQIKFLFLFLFLFLYMSV